MPILEYFKKDVRRALEEKLADDSMFRSIRGTCLRVMNDAKEIKLHPTELYYLVFCVIDRMKGQSTSQAEFYSKDEDGMNMMKFCGISMAEIRITRDILHLL